MRVTWLALEWPRAGEHSGGVGRYVERLARQLADDVELTAVVFDGAVPVEGVELVTVPAAAGRFGRYYGAAWRAGAVVKETRPDVIHAHGDDFLLRRSRVPIVRSFYGSSWREAQSSTGLRRANHIVLAVAEKIAQRRAEVRLGIAPESVGLFKCQYVFPPYLPSPRSVATREPAAEPLVVFIGSFAGRKQGKFVQRAVEAARRSGTDARLAVVGPAADSASWAPWVEHRSGLDDSEVSALLAGAWILAAPSTYEGFGIPLVEGMDHGVRVVAWPNPGSHYLSRMAGAGAPLVLAHGEAFDRALHAQLAQDPLLNPDEGEAVRRLVAKMAALGSPERMLTIYQDAIANGGGSDS